jgi:hypothetical protein
MLAYSDPVAAKRLLAEAQADVLARWRTYEQRAAPDNPPPGEGHA